MKALWGMMITDGRGKLGGQVASKNRGGSYIRTKVTPSNPQTTFQQAIRSKLASFSQGWRALSQSARNAWDSATADFTGTNIFGNSVTPTGKNLYTRLNVNLAQIGQAAITNPPLPVAVVEPTLVVEDFSEDPLVSITVGNLSVDQTYLIKASAQTSPGVSYFKGKHRVIGTMAGNAAQPFDVSTAYADRFGNPVAGQKASFQVVPIVTATGQSGVGASAVAIATV